jgi:hypothetical protein
MMFSAVWFGLSVLACCSLAGPVGRLLGYRLSDAAGKVAQTTRMIVASRDGALLLVTLAEASWPARVGDLPCSTGDGGFLILGWYDGTCSPAVRLSVSTARSAP